mmetsp:Transcript_28365/g.35611  ORF Transcript_28365/g.35611 Transcript_28365/m.35611 type:complete len:306 (+) Transcript_28365:127-1044(+)
MAFSRSQVKFTYFCCFLWISIITGFSLPSTPNDALSSNTVKKTIENKNRRRNQPFNTPQRQSKSKISWLKRKNTSKLDASASAEFSGSSSAPRIIIAGAPASGKGTQCELLKAELGVVHLSTGDMLREAVKKGTEVGMQAKGYMESGKLVPDEVIIGIVKDRLAEEDCQSCGWLLDGFPRTRAQADALEAAGIVADKFILLDVPDDMLIDRVIGRRLDPETGAIYHLLYFPPPEDAEVLNRLVHRADDTEEKARVRLEQYHSNIDAIIGCYEDILEKIDGTQDKSEVFSCIKTALEKATTYSRSI